MGKDVLVKGVMKELGNVQAYLRTGDPRMWLTPHRNLSWETASGGGGACAFVPSCKDSSTGGESRLATEEGGLVMLQGLSRVGLKASFSPRSWDFSWPPLGGDPC